jgi:hypothetical protein
MEARFENETEAEFLRAQDERDTRYKEQPIARFFDGLTYVERRPEDTFETAGRKQKTFENRRQIVGAGSTQYSMNGNLRAGIRPELVRDHDDEMM